LAVKNRYAWNVLQNDMSSAKVLVKYDARGKLAGSVLKVALAAVRYATAKDLSVLGVTKRESADVDGTERGADKPCPINLANGRRRRSHKGRMIERRRVVAGLLVV
jgi:hypothetical protein